VRGREGARSRRCLRGREGARDPAGLLETPPGCCGATKGVLRPGGAGWSTAAGRRADTLHNKNRQTGLNSKRWGYSSVEGKMSGQAPG
jgi:hypothetical protein